ncbi:uncharacterized protein [Dysidea avara]|uniref:uncharacterized protein n=1 Tax=Dysidea avara TaxID=196820 RepID=UPI00332D6E2D
MESLRIQFLLCLLYCVVLTTAQKDQLLTQNSPNDTIHVENSEEKEASAVVARVSIALVVVCLLVGIYLVWRWHKSRSDAQKRKSGNNYKRVRSSLPTDSMVDRGDDEDEDTLYDRTESTTHF